MFTFVLKPDGPPPGEEVHLSFEVSGDPSHLCEAHATPNAAADRAQEDQLQPHP